MMIMIIIIKIPIICIIGDHNINNIKHSSKKKHANTDNDNNSHNDSTNSAGESRRRPSDGLHGRLADAGMI